MNKRLLNLAVALAALAAPRLANGIDLIEEDAVFKYHKGTKEASSPRTSWTKINYSDTSWLRGQIPFYNNENVDGGTELADMNDRYTTVYLRRKFRVSDPATIGAGTLEVRADDGYVAWLNGIEISNLNKPTSTLRYSSKSTKSNSEPIMWHKTTLQNIGDIVEKGWNVLSIMLLNGSESLSSNIDILDLIAEADTVKYVEAEDFNYDGGLYKTFEEVGSGGAYKGLRAVSGVDFNNSGNASQKYRVIPGNHPGMVESMWDAERNGFDMEVDFKVGWQDDGDWYNYTRDFPEDGSYVVFGRFSSGGARVNNRLSIVTSDPTEEDQTVEDVGTFKGPATGGWNNMKFFPLNDQNGDLAILNLSGTSTVRLTKVGGNMDANYLAFVPYKGSYSDAFLDVRLTAKEREFVPPVIVSISPKPGEVTELKSITVTFSEPMSGVDATDLMINDYPAIGLQQNGNTFTFQLDQVATGKIDVWWAPDHGMGDQASPSNAFSAEEGSWNNQPTWSYELMDLAPPNLAKQLPGKGKVRQFSQAEIWFDEPVQGIDATDLMANGLTAKVVTGLGAGPYVFEFEKLTLGQVELTWSDNHNITDFNKNPNEFHGQAWSVQVDPEYSHGNVVISEFSAAHTEAYKQVEGDWIELHNRGSASVNLDGWSLTDDADNLAKWIFPNVTIRARSRMVIFATGEDISSTSLSKPSHTNFKLNPNGEYLALCSPETPRQAMSPIVFPEQAAGVSYGLNKNNDWVYFSKPTPGATNDSKTVSGRVNPVHFGLPRGFYERKAVYLTLSTDTPGANIRYTTDGDTPACCGTGSYARVGKVYTGPIKISKTSIIRAIAYKAGMLPSRVKTHSYLYGIPASQRRLPALSLVTDNRHLWGSRGIQKQPNAQQHGIAWERPMSAELIRPEDNGGFAVDCGIRIQGGGYVRPRYNPNSNLPFSKFSFRLYFRGDYGTGRLEYPLFGDTPVQSFDRIVLRAGMNDHTNPFIRDEWARRLCANVGQVSPRGNFVNLFINGQYKGYYNPCERIDTKFLADWYQTDENYDLIAQFDEVRSGNITAWRNMLNYVNRHDMKDPEHFQVVEQQLDIPAMADYFLPLIYAANDDWPHNNWRASRHKPDGLFRFINWDTEWAFDKSTSHNTIRNQLSNISPPWGNADIAKLFNGLKVSPEYQMIFADRVHRHFYNGGGLTDSEIRRIYDELYNTVKGTVRFNKSWGTNWIKGRRTPVLRHLKEANLAASDYAPKFNQFGGTVPEGFKLNLSTSRGDIYYTTNGSDPRVRFVGSVSPSAKKFDSAKGVILNDSARIKARTMTAGKWSALTEATFMAGDGSPPIRISEIMYNPQGGNAFEFIELKNIGDTEVDLSGFSFDGITYQFAEGSTPLAAGAYLLLINDANVTAFRTRHPGVRLDGLYEGSLSN
ncbi:MAG: lamin tail domain-containing protein, partial [Rubripirellula sp.]|nr:lamin tail domain-containing protein [Rubripirellula sp.]